jgi:hypothetical protein
MNLVHHILRSIAIKRSQMRKMNEETEAASFEARALPSHKQ